MSIKLKGSSDGSVSFDAPADTSPSGSDITLTLPTSAGSADQFLKNSGIAGELEYSSMVETSTGIGIGTSAPGLKLHVQDGALASAPTPNSNCDVVIEGTTNTGIQFLSSGQTQLRFGDAASTGAGSIIYNHSSNDLRLSTNGSEAMRLDSSGRLLFNTASNQGGHLVQVKDGDVSLTKLTSAAGGNDVNMLRFRVHNSANTAQDASLGGISAETASSWGGILTFHTKAANGSPNETVSERMRILPHGSIRCATNFSDSDYANNTTDYWHVFQHHTNNQAGFIIEHTGNHNPYGLIIDFSDSHPDDNTHYFMSCIDQQAIRLQIKSDGDIDNHDNSYSGFSDVKLKQDIVDAGSQWDDIKNLRVRKFRFKSDVAEHGDEAKTLIGVVAQETELVSPGLVKESPDLDKYNNDLGTTTKSVRYSVLYMKAVKALQEAQTRIEALETQNTAQQAQIDDLLARVTALEAA